MRSRVNFERPVNKPGHLASQAHEFSLQPLKLLAQLETMDVLGDYVSEITIYFIISSIPLKNALVKKACHLIKVIIAMPTHTLISSSRSILIQCYSPTFLAMKESNGLIRTLDQI